MKKLTLGLATFFALITAAFSIVGNSPDAPSEAALELLKKLAKNARASFPPIKIPKDARTENDFEREQAAWAERVIIKPALARIAAQPDAPWAKDVEPFLRQAAARVFSNQIVAQSRTLELAGDKLIVAKCHDPAVALLTGLLGVQNDSQWRFVMACAEIAQKGFDAIPDCPAVLVLHTQSLFVYGWNGSGNKAKLPPLEAKAFTAFEKMAQDGSFMPGDEEFFLFHLQLAAPAFMRNADKLTKIIPTLKLKDWVEWTIMGDMKIAQAWTARGTGWASQVTEDGWKKFNQHLAEARTFLVKAWKANPKSPVAASRMISVTMAGVPVAGESERTWFDRAIAARCDYRQAYEAMISAYRPRWIGSYELMLAFGKACMDTKRYDTDIPVYFARACNTIVSEIGDWREFYRRPEIAGPLIEQSHGWIKEPSREQEKFMRECYLALNLWLTGDNVKAAEALKALNGKPLHPDVYLKLDTHKVSEADFREEVAVGSSPMAADFAKAQVAYAEGEIEKAAAAFQRIQPKTEGYLAEIIATRLRIIEVEKQFAKGDWVKLTATKGFPEWTQKFRAKWSIGEDGSIINKGNDSSGYLVHRARIGSNFEMRLEFSVESKEKCCRRCDIVFGWSDSKLPTSSMEPMNYATFGQFGKFPPDAKFTPTYRQPWDFVKRGIKYEDNNKIHLVCKNGKLTFTANGQVACTDKELEGMFIEPDKSRVGIGNMRWCVKNITTIRNIEVRRLPE